MTPALYAVLGPLKGTTIELDATELSIGRDSSNRLPIPDLHLSRKHCSINQDGESYALTDLNSTNGVLVNGIPVRQKTLQHGDRIELGASLLIFVEHEDTAPSIALSENALNAGSIVTIQWDQTPGSERGLQELNLLLSISAAIASIQDLNQFGKKLLDIVFENVPCKRGALFLTDPSGKLELVCQKSTAPNQKAIRISREISEQVVQQKSGLLANEIQYSNDSVSSLLCSPFILFSQFLGMLYLDSSDKKNPLTESHLRLVNAITGIAAPALKNIQILNSLKEKTSQLADQLRMDRTLIGESPSMKKVLSILSKIAPADTTVLITGESGTGKELAARALHQNSPRSEHPFIALNCAAIPENLMESELFGHEKGAFTGAISQKIGKLELADGGTLFLDEIGELEIGLQAKLLRVLQEREFERLGSNRPIKTDIRLLAASNRDLEKSTRDGQFRQDLFYRLNVISLKMPPLREMEDDIILLARYLVSKFNQKLTRQVRGISPEAQELMIRYEWPGNVRELENTIERAILLGSTDMILPEDLPESLAAVEVSSSAEAPKNLHESVNEHKKQLILKAFEGTDMNFNTAASRLGIHSAHLYRLVRTLKLNSLLKK
jgi:transcriptional regulator with GAF, ATPase, and Fis domain